MRFRLSRRQVAVDGVSVRYQVVGCGEPLVLVHGLSGSSLWWSRNVNALATRYQLYLVDLPGFGDMTHLRASFAVAHAADWLASWMEAARLPSAHFVGHSMGGYVCMRLAVNRPELVRSLTLAAPAGVPAYPTVLHEIVPLLLSVRTVMPSFLPVLTFDALRVGPSTLLRAASELIHEDIRGAMGSIRAPTLLIWGQQDLLVPPWCGGILRDGIPDARLIVLPHASHVVMYDSPTEFNAATLRFLAELSLPALA